MLRIGIPNRSSLLHTLGAAHCIAAGFLPREKYSAPRLYYRCGNAEIVLTRCAELCTMMQHGDLDLMLNGGDYVAECLPDLKMATLPIPVMQVRFALIAPPAVISSQSFSLIYTKFPRLARTLLSTQRIQYESLVLVSGGVEAFCLMHSGSAALDVVCTGATVEMNELNAVPLSEPVVPAWYARQFIPQSIQDVAADEALTHRLRDYFAAHLAMRDRVLESVIDQLMGAGSSAVRTLPGKTESTRLV